MIKKTAAAAAALACALALTGCSESILSSKTETSAENIWTAKDDDIVAWATSESLSAEDKEFYNITFKEFYSEYAFTIANYGIDETNSEYASYAEYYRKNIIDMLSNEKIILKKAEEMGLDDLTAEEMDEIDKAYTENLSTWYSYYETQAKEELGLTDDETSGTDDSANDERILEKAKELFNEYLANYGLTEETFLKWQTNTFIQKKVLEELYKQVEVTDAEVDEYIAKLTDEAKKAYEESITDYEKDSEYRKVWIPAGSKNIKYICVKISSSDSAEISAARTESGADNAEIDKLRDEKLAEIKDKAQAALDKATAEGADFDAVVKEYSADYSETTEGETTLIVKGTSSMYDVLYDELYKLEKPGDISGLIPTDRGYYILQYVSDAEVTEKDVEEYAKIVKETLTENEQNELANSTIEKWRDEVGYEYDYEKLNFEKEEEETSSDTESSEASE